MRESSDDSLMERFQQLKMIEKLQEQIKSKQDGIDSLKQNILEYKKIADQQTNQILEFSALNTKIVQNMKEQPEVFPSKSYMKRLLAIQQKRLQRLHENGIRNSSDLQFPAISPTSNTFDKKNLSRIESYGNSLYEEEIMLNERENQYKKNLELLENEQIKKQKYDYIDERINELSINFDRISNDASKYRSLIESEKDLRIKHDILLQELDRIISKNPQLKSDAETQIDPDLLPFFDIDVDNQIFELEQNLEILQQNMKSMQKGSKIMLSVLKQYS